MTGGTGRYRVELTPALDESTAAEWDSLALRHRNFYLSSRWLAFVGHEPGVTTRYCTVRDKLGRLVGAFPVAHNPAESNDLYQPQQVFAGLSGDWTSSEIQVGARRGYANDLLTAPALSAPETRDVLAAGLEETGQWARGTSPTTPVAWHMQTDQARDLASAVPAAEPLLSCSIAELDLPGAGLDDYFHALGSKRGRELRREMRRAAEAGLDFDREKLSAVWEEAGPLVAQTMRRYGHDWDDERGRTSLSRHAEWFDDTAIAFTCRLAGVLLGVTVAYRWGDTLVLRMVGFDYVRLPGAYEYFSLVYYVPLAYGYADGIRSLSLGTGSLRAKCERGARLVPRWTVILDPLQGPPEAAAHSWNGRACARLGEVSRREMRRVHDQAQAAGLLDGG